MTEPIYVDPNAFTLPVLGKDSLRPRGAAQLLKRIGNERVTAYTSALTWDGACWVTTKVLGVSDGVSAAKKLLTFPNPRFVDANPLVVGTAQSLIERYSSKGLGPREAIHCASALTKNATTIASDDACLDLVNEVKRSYLESFLQSAADGSA